MPVEAGVAVITFSGDGSEQVKVYADEVSQPIDNITATFAGETTHHKASGTCIFNNPYASGGGAVLYKAETDQGEFIGAFRSNGEPPISADLQ